MEESKIKEADGVSSKGFSFRIDRLDMDNPEHIVWAYKNIQQVYNHSTADFSRMIKMMADHKLLDFNTSLVILEEIGGILQAHFGEAKEDEELSFVAKKCGLVVTNRTANASPQCVDYLYRLVLPFSKTCTKQVVDIVAFLFTRTTMGEFDELFEIFDKKKDFLIELYLLKVKLMRERSIRYKCKRCRGADKMIDLEMEECIKNMKISFDSKDECNKEVEKDQEKKTDFYSIEDDNANRKESNEKFPEDLSFSQGRPFFESSIESFSEEGNKYLDETGEAKIDRDILNHKSHQASGDLPYKTLCKCRRNESVGETCLCASYKLSDEIHCLTEAKRHLLDIESISPRFFLENVALYLSLSFDKELLNLFRKYINTEYRSACAFHIFKLKTVDPETLEAMIKEMKDAKKEILKSDHLVITTTTFNLYAEWCMDTFGSISISSINDYSDISRLYIKFLRVFPHKKMFLILQRMCGSRIDRVSNTVYGHIAYNLEEIVKITLNLFDNVHSNDEEKMPSTLLDDGKIFGNSNRIDTSSFCIRQELEKIVLEVCKRYRKSFLSQIKTLFYFSDDDFKEKIIKILSDDHGNDWRYRRALLHSYKEHPCLFKGAFNLDSFTKDPVFIVRRTALDIKEELGLESVKLPEEQSL